MMITALRGEPVKLIVCTSRGAFTARPETAASARQSRIPSLGEAARLQNSADTQANRMALAMQREQHD